MACARRDLAGALALGAEVQLKAGHPQAAAAQAKEAVEIGQALLKQVANSAELQQDLGIAHYILAETSLAAGDRVAAAASYDRCIECFSKSTSNADHPMSSRHARILAAARAKRQQLGPQ